MANAVGFSCISLIDPAPSASAVITATAQARDGHPPLLPGAGVRAAWREIRKRVKHLGPDRTLYPDIAALRARLRDDTLPAAAAAASGALQ